MKLFRIPIKIEPQFFVVTIFLAFSRARDPILIIEWLGVVLFSVLVHELGHALVARAFGLTPQIRLYQMGGLTSWTSEKQLSPLSHLAISLAGPASGFLIGSLVWFTPSALSLRRELTEIIYADLLWVNFGWSIFNLLPILPMDGGQVLVTLEGWLRKQNDSLISHMFSFLAAAAIGLIAFKSQALWIGFLGIYFAYLNGSVLWRRWQSHRDRRLGKLLEEARAAVNRNELDAAIDVLSQVAAQAKSNQVKQQALYLTIVVYIKQKNFAEAETELRRYAAFFGEDYYLEATLYFFRGDMEALPKLKGIFESHPDEQTGVMLCKTLLGIGDFTAALELCRHPALAGVRWQLMAEAQSQAFNHGDFKFSAAAGIAAYDQKADPNIAYNVACAFARDANQSEAITWTERAIASGFRDEQALRSDLDLESIRSSAEFAALLKRFDQSGN